MLGVAAHVDVAACTPESVLDHAVDHFLVAEFHAVPHTIDVVWGVRHRLLSAGDDNLLVACLDRLGRKHHRFKAGSTDLVDSQRRDVGRKSRLQESLSGWRLTGSSLKD